MERPQLNIRLTAEQHDRITKDAQEAGLSITGYVLWRVFGVAKETRAEKAERQEQPKEKAKNAGIKCGVARCARMGACTCGFKTPGS